jgi:hypothetical protein
MGKTNIRIGAFTCQYSPGEGGIVNTGVAINTTGDSFLIKTGHGRASMKMNQVLGEGRISFFVKRLRKRYRFVEYLFRRANQ